MAAPLTDEWIRRELEICDRATQGKWRDGFDDGSGRIWDAGGAYITLEEPDPLPFPRCIVRGGDYEGTPIGVLKQEDVDSIIAAHEGYPLTLQLLKETRALLRHVLLELDHMVDHNPECLPYPVTHWAEIPWPEPPTEEAIDANTTE